MKHALLLLFVIATQAHAQIIYTDVDPDAIYNASNDTCQLDLDNDGNIDFLIVQRTLQVQCPTNCNPSNTRPRSSVRITPLGTNAVANSASFAAQLPEWQAIDPASAWNSASDQVLLTQSAPFCGQGNCIPGGYTGAWLFGASVDSPKFLGLRFDSAGTTYHGWARLSILNGTSFTLKDYAYKSTPDEGLLAGETQCAIPFGLSVNNVDSNTVSLAWQSSNADTFNLRYRPTGTDTWSVIDMITATNYTLTGLAGCTEYEFQVEGLCDGLWTGYSASFIRTTLGCGACIELTYCPSYSILIGDEYIARVAVGTLDNQSGGNDGYGDFTALGTALQIGQGHPITLEPVFVLFDVYPMYLRVYVDLNQNGNFSGPGELVYSASVFEDGPISGTLNIPASALTGSTRMRVVMVEGDPSTTSCDYYNIGETEDYCIELVDNTTGVGEAPTSGQLRLFPNPFTSTLTVALGMNKAGVATCTVRALTGQVLVTRTVATTPGQSPGQASGPSSITLDLAALAPGTYLLEVQVDGERIVRKVVKE